MTSVPKAALLVILLAQVSQCDAACWIFLKRSTYNGQGMLGNLHLFFAILHMAAAHASGWDSPDWLSNEALSVEQLGRDEALWAVALNLAHALPSANIARLPVAALSC